MFILVIRLSLFLRFYGVSFPGKFGAVTVASFSVFSMGCAYFVRLLYVSLLLSETLSSKQNRVCKLNTLILYVIFEYLIYM